MRGTGDESGQVTHRVGPPRLVDLNPPLARAPPAARRSTRPYKGLARATRGAVKQRGNLASPEHATPCGSALTASLVRMDRRIGNNAQEPCRTPLSGPHATARQRYRRGRMSRPRNTPNGLRNRSVGFPPFAPALVTRGVGIQVADELHSLWAGA